MKRLLLHSCCGPCSTAVIEKLIPDWEITLFYFDPNITDRSEYEHRRDEQLRFINEYAERTGNRVSFIEGDYDPEAFLTLVRGHENDREGGARCALCFRTRLEKTAALAKELGFDAFDTTLTVSPYKDFDVISAIGRDLSSEYGVLYLEGNYKKKNGYGRSIEFSREYGLYRQHYCGCVYSKRDSEACRESKDPGAGTGA